MAVEEPPQSERHIQIITLWINMFAISRLFKETTDIVMSGGPRDSRKIEAIMRECNDIRDRHIAWRKGYIVFTMTHNACNEGGFKAREFLAVSMSGQLLVDRFMTALDPLALNALDLEIEVQSLANMILMMYKETGYSEKWRCDVLMVRKVRYPAELTVQLAY
jgi:hypothetical protein